MRARNLLALIASLGLFAASASAQTVSGVMDDTMNRGESKTFTLTIQVRSGGFDGPVVIVINSSDGIVLGKTTLSVPFDCNETYSVSTCRGNLKGSGGETVTLTQRMTIAADAPRDKASWSVQVVGDTLSGVSPKAGVITIPGGRPRVIMTEQPKGMLRAPQEAPYPDAIGLLNDGSAPATVTVQITTGADIFELQTAKSVYTLESGASVVVGFMEKSATAKDRDGGGIFRGVISATGEGVQPELGNVPFKLQVKARPNKPPKPEPEKNRSEHASLPGDPNPLGIIRIRNSGEGRLEGLPISDAPWLISEDEEVSLGPGESKDVKFTIDLARQGSVLADMGGTGSLTGTMAIRYLLPATGSSGRIVTHAVPGTGTTSVTIVSTVKASVTATPIPPLPDTHGQLFIAGIGHVQGSVGLFVSDLSIYPQVELSNATYRWRSLADVDLYYTPLGGGGTARKATLASLAHPAVAAMGDVVSTVYGENQQVGSLQIRTPGFLAGTGVVGINANVFNVSSANGTYGTSIPVFSFSKFRCGSDLTKKLYLTGLRKDAGGHTNFYLQETCGSQAKITLDFLDASGNKIGSTTADVPPFAAIQLGQATLPEGAVTAVLSHANGSAGGFVAYATPVDRASGDTWAQVDWPNLRGYDGNVPVIVPVAGALPGANNTYFRTDVSIMNTGTTAGTGTLRFYNRTGEVIDRTINLPAQRTATYVDVTTSLFGIGTPHVGHLVFTPTSGRFVVTSRNYSTPAGSNATFGTAVPVLNLNEALRPTQVRRIGGIEDASPATIANAQPATFRSNIGLIETKGEAATIKVTVMYRYTSSLVSTTHAKSATFELAPRQFILTGLGNALFGANRAEAGDLHNVLVEFEVISGTGNVLPFVSSIDNGTGDSTFRIE